MAVLRIAAVNIGSRLREEAECSWTGFLLPIEHGSTHLLGTLHPSGDGFHLSTAKSAPNQPLGDPAISSPTHVSFEC